MAICNCSCSVSALEKAKENNFQHHHNKKVHERPELETMISLKKTYGMAEEEDLKMEFWENLCFL